MFTRPGTLIPVKTIILFWRYTMPTDIVRGTRPKRRGSSARVRPVSIVIAPIARVRHLNARTRLMILRFTIERVRGGCTGRSETIEI